MLLVYKEEGKASWFFRKFALTRTEDNDEKRERVLTLGVGQEAVERRDVAWARGDSDGVVLREAVSLGNTCTPRETMESGICASNKTETRRAVRSETDVRASRTRKRNCGTMKT